MLLMAVSCGPTKSDMLLAMEPVQGASLYQKMHEQGVKFSSKEAVNIVYDVANGKAIANARGGTSL